jgi:replicative DNA helicase
MSSFYNLEFEKQFISGILRKPEILAEIPFLSEKDFGSTNKVVFSAIKSILAEGKILDKFLLIDKLKSANIKIAGEIQADLYINALGLISINEESTIQVAREIKNLTVARELFETAAQIQNKIKELRGENAIKLVGEVSAIFNKKINILDSREDEPVDLFLNVEQEIEAIGNNPQVDGVICPYPIFRSLFGDFSKNSCQFFAARTKAGKSTFLMNLLMECSILYPDFSGLLLDTEMTTMEVKRRAVSVLSGVGEYYLRTGFWRKNHEMTAKVRGAWKVVSKYFNKVDHLYVGGKSIEEIISIIKRWHYKKVLPLNKKCLVVYDYIKLGSTDLDNLKGGGIKDYQLAVKKADLLKQTATELGVCVISSGQTNRTNAGRSDSSTVNIDGSAIGLSDQISHICDSTFLLQRLSLDQVAEYQNSATHALIPLYSRSQGEQASGFDSHVKFCDSSGKTKYIDNFLFFRFDTFKTTEIEDFRAYAARKNIKDIKTDNNNGQQKLLG